MKNIKLFMCLVFIAFSVPLFAQTQEHSALPDTLQIRLQGRNQVFLTGKSLRSLAEYKRADSLKTAFFADLKKALNSGAFPEIPKRIHYFVNPQGKRRLKAELNEDLAAKLDLPYEKTRMILDLPPLHYTIYDLAKNVDIHFFLEDTSAVAIAANTSLNSGVQVMEKDRKKLSGLTSYKLEKTGFGFESRNLRKPALLQLEVNAQVGAMLMGNQPSPVLGYDIFFTIPYPTKFSYNHYRIGFTYNSFVLSDFADGQFRNINPGISWHGSFQLNSDKKKDLWWGINVGSVGLNYAAGLPKNALKFGFISHYDRNSFSLDIIKLKKINNEDQMMMFTYKRAIF